MSFKKNEARDPTRWRVFAVNQVTDVKLLIRKVNSISEYKVNGLIFNDFAKAVCETQPDGNAEMSYIVMWLKSNREVYVLFDPKGIKVKDFDVLQDAVVQAIKANEDRGEIPADKIERRRKHHQKSVETLMERRKRALINREKAKLIMERRHEKLNAKVQQSAGELSGSW